jgi:putative thioredoxin
LTPVLERVAADANGEFELVKINIDENPQVAAELGARSIPLVIAFKDGEPVSSFVGAQPEAAVRKFVQDLAPSEADLMVSDATRALDQGRNRDAQTILEAALDIEPRHARARLVLAELLGDEGRLDEALAVLDKADPSPEVDQLRAALRLTAPSDVDVDDLKARADAGDEKAAITLSNVLLAEGDSEAALEILLDAVRTNGAAQDVTKQAMLDVFRVLGNDDPLVRTYRARLASALF